MVQCFLQPTTLLPVLPPRPRELNPPICLLPWYSNFTRQILAFVSYFYGSQFITYSKTRNNSCLKIKNLLFCLRFNAFFFFRIQTLHCCFFFFPYTFSREKVTYQKFDNLFCRRKNLMMRKYALDVARLLFEGQQNKYELRQSNGLRCRKCLGR